MWHRGRAEFPERHPGLVTVRVRKDVPSLRTQRLVREIERSFRVGAKRGEFRIVHYSIQHDHLHFLVEAANATALSCGMKCIAARLARAVNRVFGRRGAVLDGRYHHRALATPRKVRAALAYVLLNARKHAAKRLPSAMATVPVLDPASSARWFEGWADAPAPIGAPGVAFRVGPPADLHSNHCSDPPAIAPAQTWLLRLGWRRYGLIRPAEIPGSKRSVGRSRI